MNQKLAQIQHEQAIRNAALNTIERADATGEPLEDTAAWYAPSPADAQAVLAQARRFLQEFDAPTAPINLRVYTAYLSARAGQPLTPDQVIEYLLLRKNTLDDERLAFTVTNGHITHWPLDETGELEEDNHAVTEAHRE